MIQEQLAPPPSATREVTPRPGIRICDRVRTRIRDTRPPPGTDRDEECPLLDFMIWHMVIHKRNNSTRLVVQCAPQFIAYRL